MYRFKWCYHWEHVCCVKTASLIFKYLWGVMWSHLLIGIQEQMSLADLVIIIF